MGKRITIIQGHPSPERKHLGHALADSYADGAMISGRHDVRRIEVAQLEFPLLRTAEDWKTGPLPATLQEAQEAMEWAEHLVVIYPLWTGATPALLKGFFEQVLRPGFAFRPKPGGGMGPGLRGKSARVIVTMGMPALLCRLSWHARGIRAFNRGVLGFCGVGPVRTTYIGSVDGNNFNGARWLASVRELGRRAV